MEHSLRTVNGQVKLFSYPVSEVDALCGDVLLSLENVTVTPDTENILKGVSSTCCDLVATIDLGDATEVGFKVRMSERAGREELVIRYDRMAGKLYVDKNKTGSGSYLGVYEPDMVTLDGNRITLRILLDRICYDVYGNGGEVAVAGLVYSDFRSTGMEFFTNGTATVESLVIYNMDESLNTAPDTPPEEDTDTPTEPVVPETDEATPDTPPGAAPDGETEPDTAKPKGGCGSVTASCATVLYAAAGAVALKKKKEH